MRDDKRFILDGFVFSTRKDYERACKEKETIEYLVANSNMSDMKAVLKIYNKAVEKKSFQTVIGLEFIENMRKRLLSSGIVKENQLAYVPVVPRVKEKMSGKSITDKDVLEKNVESITIPPENEEEYYPEKWFRLTVLLESDGSFRYASCEEIPPEL